MLYYYLFDLTISLIILFFALQGLSFDFSEFVRFLLVHKQKFSNIVSYFIECYFFLVQSTSIFLPLVTFCNYIQLILFFIVIFFLNKLVSSKCPSRKGLAFCSWRSRPLLNGSLDLTMATSRIRNVCKKRKITCIRIK